MPLVAHTHLPTFDKLTQEGQDILPLDRAAQQDIRELHIGLLNMMPDAALEATERQFLRLIGAANLIAQFHVHLFTLDSLPRGPKGQQHIAQYYESFETIKHDGLDALIISGANPVHEQLEDEPFWLGLVEVMDWASQHVTSTLCSCLSSHAILQDRWNLRRQPLGYKRWGVYNHNVIEPHHPLVSDINTRFWVPHSRYNEISPEQFESAGLVVLAKSPEAGVHLAVSPDQFRMIFLQGHPEYDSISLLKEYKREVMQWYNGYRHDYPPFPDHFLGRQAKAILNEYEMHLRRAKKAPIDKLNEQAIPTFPDDLLTPLLDNTWRDTAKAIMSNWLGKVYQLTNSQRHLPFMANVNPDDPLKLNQIKQP